MCTIACICKAPFMVHIGLFCGKAGLVRENADFFCENVFFVYDRVHRQCGLHGIHRAFSWRCRALLWRCRAFLCMIACTGKVPHMVYTGLVLWRCRALLWRCRALLWRCRAFLCMIACTGKVPHMVYTGLVLWRCRALARKGKVLLWSCRALLWKCMAFQWEHVDIFVRSRAPAKRPMCYT